MNKASGDRKQPKKQRNKLHQRTAHITITPTKRLKHPKNKNSERERWICVSIQQTTRQNYSYIKQR